MAIYKRFAATFLLISVLITICAVAGECKVVCVKTAGGNDANSGESWLLAKATVQAGINAAVAGDEVWVAAGTYTERINLKAGVALYGGYTGNEGDPRNPATNVTILDGNQAGSVVTVPAGATNTTIIYGFTIRNGKAANGGGIYCNASSPTISNNIISGNIADGTISNSGGFGGGIYANGAPVIFSNTITDNTAKAWMASIYSGGGGDGGGVYVFGGAANISGNNIISNTADPAVGLDDYGYYVLFGGFGAGINAGSGSPRINNNVIKDNIYGDIVDPKASVIVSSGEVSRNVISGNKCAGLSCSNAGVFNNVISDNERLGVQIGYGSTRFINNTVVANGDGGLYLERCSGDVANNIITFNTVYGISRYSASAVLRNNCVYGNSSRNYQSVSPGAGDISVDPLFANYAGKDYHLMSSSPCIDRGWIPTPNPMISDFDGDRRMLGSAIDIGADETWPIRDMKTADNGTCVGIYSVTVSAAFADFFYLESDDRTSGIRVEKASHGLAAGMKANVAGTLDINSNGERCITAISAVQNGAGNIKPVAMINSAVGGGQRGYQDGVWSNRPGLGSTKMVGLNNIGLLVRTWGKPAKTGDSTFTVDDGSNNPVECVLPAGVTIDPGWAYVGVTGVSSCRKVGNELRSVIFIRNADDVRGF